MAETISRKSIIYDLLLNDKKFTKSTKGASKSVSKVDKSVSTLNSSLKGLAVTFAAAFSIRQIALFTKEAALLAEQAKGVRAAFVRLNDAGLLTRLKAATQGTVNDLKLMQAAVKAKNFQVPIEKLASFFEFAAKRARDTGESVDFLVDSIVNGIGRKSSLVLDNLGISAARLQKEIKKVGDFGQAAANIIEEELNGSAELLVSTTERLSVSMDNLQLAFGEAIISGGLFGDIMRGVTNDLDRLTDSFAKDKLSAELERAAKTFRVVLDKDQLSAYVDEMILYGEVLEGTSPKVQELANKLELINSDNQSLIGQPDDIRALDRLAEKIELLSDEKLVGFSDELKVAKKLYAELVSAFAARRFDEGVPEIEATTEAFHNLNEALDQSGPSLQTFAELYLKTIRELKAAQEEIFDEGGLFKLPEEIIDEAEVSVSDKIDKENLSRKERIDLFNEEGQAVINSANAFLEAAGIEGEAAKGIVLAQQAIAISTGIAKAIEVGFPQNIAAIITTLAAVVAGFTTIASFEDGTDYLDSSSAPHGTDTIPIMADRGEAIIPKGKNAANPGLAKAWIGGNLDDYIQTHFIDPALLNTQLTQPKDNIDYSGKFYREFLTSIENNSQNKSMIGLLNKIEGNTSKSNTAKYARA